jgi:hypothetical protein
MLTDIRAIKTFTNLLDDYVPIIEAVFGTNDALDYVSAELHVRYPTPTHMTDYPFKLKTIIAFSNECGAELNRNLSLYFKE